MTRVHLTAEDVPAVAGLAVDDQDVVVRDAGPLGSAVHRPAAAVFGQEAYPDLFDEAAALLQSLAADRPFIEGNKRTAWTSCVVFPAMNDVQLRPDVDAAERPVTAVATGAADEAEAISEALRELSEPPV
ncbi:type II toxin-antitoxin system death-on-curing family toxin [Streptomyces sp. Tu 3180]|uniref:type II toxin-antitoxin system death-on-curing family toxin n=1 Tax=Streptomyces sp. Tu 3180 TaxID=2682611 RepID=UPI00135C4FD9|nr:type II toxin-antitoxin system death-on-curing family toxin [Streptomyces sp. Tu 3180]KAF3465684.1 type II toxin-antitoxin system death-on-curing family toxin [Streptomyces sp. Tu 3180]